MLMNYSVPVSLGVNDLPFEEEFIRYPSVHFQMEAGSNVEATYLTRSVSYLKLGSNIFEFVCVKTPTDFDTADYFNPANASNIARMRLCELDLTSIPANEKVVLHILGNLVTPVETDTLTARCRVLAGSDGNQLLCSLEGITVNMPSEYDQNWYYELEGGIRHRVVIEFSGAERNDLLAVGRVSVERPQIARSVALKLEEVPADGPNLGQGNFTLWVTNQSVAPEEELLVKAYRGDRWVQSTTVSLRGMQSKMVKIPVDLSTTEAEGELIPIRFECVVDPLNPTANGKVQHSVYNFGQVVPMGTSHLEEGLYGLVNVDPKITYTVQGKVVFTDNGGLLRPYSGQQSSTIKFLPSDPSMRVRIRFTYFNTTYNQAALAVYTMQSPDNLSRDGLRVRQVMMGDVVGPSTPSCTFVSEAADGGVLLYFASGDSGVEGGGWKAVVDMVPSMNPIALTGVEATRLGGDAEAKIPVGVRVLNRWKYPQSNVVVNVIGENGYLMLDTLKEVAPGEALYTVGDGQEIEVEPDADHYFQGWSDGVATPVRTDRMVKRNVQAEAIFGKYYTIPATEDFELGVLGNGWYSESKGKSYNPWGITTLKQSELEPLDGHYAYCNSDAMGRNGRTESYIYTPCYRLGNAWSGDLIVSFDYGSKNVNARTDQFWVELSVDTGAWVKIGEVEHNTRGTLLLTVAGSELEGKHTVQFRWGYKAMWAYAVGIDNVVIAKKSNEKLNLQYVADPTGSCTFDKLRDDGTLDVPNITAQEVIAGERPAAVRANPAPGFTFVSWEDGSADSIRMPKRGVYISQTFTATCRNMLKSTITYQVAPAGAGVCRMDGQDVAMQEVDTGGDAKPVTAVPASGYRFLYWSDSGDTCKVYTKRNVRTSEIVTAVFAKVDSFAAEFLVVNEAGEPLLGAAVAISGQEFATNADGRASILLEEGDYLYRVGMPGYHTWEGIAKVSLIKSLNRAVLAKSHFTVTFAVGLNGERIPGVSIKVNGQTRITDTLGLASIELPNGIYTYQASKEGYDATQGEITVKDADLLVEIPLIRSQNPKPVPNPDIVESTLLAGILASPNPCGDVLRLEHTEALRLVELLNASGQAVLSSRHDGQPALLLGVGALPAGLYILRLVDCQGGIRNLRVVKR